MPEEERSAPGSVPGLAEGFAAQLRGLAEGLARLGEHLPGMPGTLPLPGTMTAAQLKSITDGIAAQRRAIGALRDQLSSFDEQLAVLEQVVGPLTEWSSRWAELEARLLGHSGRPPQEPP
jgi:hypothetical protein